MTVVTITVTQKGLRVDQIEKLFRDTLKEKFPDAAVSIGRYDKPESRADRFADAKEKIGQGRAMIEELQEELQNWRDGLPENMQDGEKANQLDEAIQNLESCRDSAEEAENAEVEFPSMMG